VKSRTWLDAVTAWLGRNSREPGDP
jgi:hypothetical protein